MEAADGRGDEPESLRLLASAIAGQALDVALADVGMPSWSDGRTVFLERGASPTGQVVMLAVQASLVAAGSFDPNILRQLVRHPGLARRYLAVEGHRALAVTNPVLPPSVCWLINPAVAASVRTAAASLAKARGPDTVPRAPDLFGIINVKRTLATLQRDPASPLGRAVDPERARTTGSLTSRDANETEVGTLDDLLSSPVGGGGAIGRLLQKLLSPARRRSGGGPLGSDAATHVTAHGLGSGRHDVPVSWLAERDATAHTVAEQAGTAYPEWDEIHRHYRADWCTVMESDAPMGPATPQWPSSEALRRPLARLGAGMTQCRRQPQGEDLDIDGAVEAHIDTAAGTQHGEDVYLESRRLRRDLGVLVLLDVSGSAAEPGSAGRSVHEHQQRAAMALTTALHDLGDRVALYAFNSRGRHAVQMMRIKGFDDRLDVGVGQRLAGLEAAAYTRLGAAIRHGTSIIEQRSGTPSRLLVVLSDGLAFDHGYGDRYGEADARRSLTEARRRGIGCLCLTIGSATDPDTLRRVFGSAAHATMSRPEELPGLIAPLFEAAVRSAERQQRTYVRHERTRERLELEMEMR